MGSGRPTARGLPARAVHRPDLNGVYTVRSSDGGDLQRVTSDPGGDDCPSDYSPNGKRLVFTRSNETTYAIYTVKLDGSGLQQITPAGMNFDFCNGSWSPQGNEILFSAHVPDRSTEHDLGRPLRRQRAAADPGPRLRWPLLEPDVHRLPHAELVS